jgi:hypothetical protein
VIASPSELMVAYLIAQGIAVAPGGGTTVPWQITSAQMPSGPDSPNEYITVYDTGGLYDGRIHRTGVQVLHPTVSIQVRCRNYDEGWQKIKAIESLIMTLWQTNIVVGAETVMVHAALATSAPTYIGVEEKNQCYMLSFNVRLSI